MISIKPTPTPTSPAQRRRSGLVSVVVLIGLIIIGLICAGLLRVALSRRAEVAMIERRGQAEWLAESGLERASSRLAASGDYSGETWDVVAKDLGNRGAARVVIVVKKVADRPDRRQVRVTAEYPIDATLRSSRTKEMMVFVVPPPTT